MAGNENLSTFDPRSEIGIALGPSHKSRQSIRAYMLLAERIKVRGHYTVLNALPIGFKWKLKTPIDKAKNSSKDPIHNNDRFSINK
jgi:hypothetical protein